VSASNLASVYLVDLSRDGLHWATAKALGYVDYPSDSVEAGAYWYLDPSKAPFCARIRKSDWQPTLDWRQAGELLQKFIMRLGVSGNPIYTFDNPPSDKRYYATAYAGPLSQLGCTDFGPDYPTAICRAVVKEKFGDPMQIPESLLESLINPAEPVGTALPTGDL